MITEFCDCEEGFGIPHDHQLDYGPWVETWEPFGVNNFRQVRRRPLVGEKGVWRGIQIKDQVRIWVDWKSVAKALCKENPRFA